MFWSKAVLRTYNIRGFHKLICINVSFIASKTMCLQQSVYVVQWTRFSRTIKELSTFILTQPYGWFSLEIKRRTCNCWIRTNLILSRYRLQILNLNRGIQNITFNTIYKVHYHFVQYFIDKEKYDSIVLTIKPLRTVSTFNNFLLAVSYWKLRSNDCFRGYQAKM